MKRLYVPTTGTDAWRERLVDPEKQWQRQASAFEMAVAWEHAARSERGLPSCIGKLLDQAPELKDCRLLFGSPEHSVSLKGRGKASQTDLWALLWSAQGQISLAVEGKGDEDFGETLKEWMKQASTGKEVRLAGLTNLLKCAPEPPDTLRYQLFHRTASAVLEAQRFGAGYAVMMVQSFRTDSRTLDDFIAFGECLGAKVAKDSISPVPGHEHPKLYLGWATAPLCSDEQIAQVAV